MARLYESSDVYESSYSYDGTIVYATGAGSGAGSGTATGVRTVLRTATGSGAGTQTATGVHTHVRSATGSGAGTQIAIGLHTHVRSATGSGTGTQTATGVHTHERSATGSGTGSETPATWVRLYLFRTPTDLEVDFTGAYRVGLATGANRRAFALYRFYEPGPRGRNVWKLTDGTYTENQPPDDTGIDRIYYGGHDHHVDDTEKAELVAAGYGAYVN